MALVTFTSTFGNNHLMYQRETKVNKLNIFLSSYFHVILLLLHLIRVNIYKLSACIHIL